MNGSNGGPQPSKRTPQLFGHGVLAVSYRQDLVIIRAPRDSPLDLGPLQSRAGEFGCRESELCFRPKWILRRQTLAGVDPCFVQGRGNRCAILELRAPVP